MLTALSTSRGSWAAVSLMAAMLVPLHQWAGELELSIPLVRSMAGGLQQEHVSWPSPLLAELTEQWQWVAAVG